MATGNLTAAAAPRPSFFATWLMFVRGAGKGLWMPLLMCAGMMMPLLLMWLLRATPHHAKPLVNVGRAFGLHSVMLIFCFAMGMWQHEGEMGERVAFLSVIAQRVDPRRLLLAPMCALAFVTTVPLALARWMPAAVAVALLGVAWCAIGTTRLLWKWGGWSLLALPIFAAHPGLVYAAHFVLGWGGAAALSIACAIGVLAFQPRAYAGEPLSRLLNGDRTPARDVVARRAPSGAISAPAGGHRRAGSAGQFMRFQLGERAWLILTIGVAGIGCLGLLQRFVAQGNLIMAPALIAGGMLSRAYSGNMYEFLRTRPFNRGQRIVESALPVVLIVLAAPAAAAFLTNPDLFNRGGLVGFFKPHPPGEIEMRYLREVLGATFLPETWPANGLSPDLWMRLRPFLFLDALRALLLIVAMMFAFPILKVGETMQQRKIPATNGVMMAAAFGTMMWSLMGLLHPNRPQVRLWFLALVAVVSMAHWIWRARAINTPPRKGSA